MPDRPDPVAQVHAILADFATQLAPRVRDACKAMNAVGVEMAKRAPAIEKAAGASFAAFAAAVLPPARKDPTYTPRPGYREDWKP